MNIAERARTYGMPAERVDDGDVLGIRERVQKVAAEIRARRLGPWFLECWTYRWKEHVGPNDDFQVGYRPKTEADPWFKKDQVKVIGDRLEASVRQEIERGVEAEIREAIGFAEESPFPEPGELYSDVFKEKYAAHPDLR